MCETLLGVALNRRCRTNGQTCCCLLGQWHLTWKDAKKIEPFLQFSRFKKTESFPFLFPFAEKFSVKMHSNQVHPLQIVANVFHKSESANHTAEFQFTLESIPVESIQICSEKVVFTQMRFSPHLFHPMAC